MYTVSQYTIKRNGRDLSDTAWDTYSSQDEHNFKSFDEADKFYNSIDLPAEWQTELESRAGFACMKRTVFAKELYVSDENSDKYGDTLVYEEYTSNDWLKWHNGGNGEDE